MSSTVLAYVAGLLTYPAGLGLLVLWVFATGILNRWGWTAHLRVFDDTHAHHVLHRHRRSIGPFHAGTREWWERHPWDDQPGVRRRAWWVAVGRFGGRGVSVARGREIQPHPDPEDEVSTR